MEFVNDDLLKLVLSLLVGAVIGAEREYRSKSAGFRTITLICLGSTLFTILSIKIGAPGSPDRIASNIVTGIGFLGAGVIFHETRRVSGLTTAAIIWSVAAVGMGIGAGYYTISLFAGICMLVVLFLFNFFETRIDAASQIRNYRIVTHYEKETLLSYEKLFKENGLRVYRGTQSRTGDEITGRWEVHGSAKSHEAFVNEMLNDSSVKEFDF